MKKTSHMEYRQGWHRWTYVLSIATLIGLFAVNLVGFVDTETGSALGCGHDWPLCNGAVIPHVWGIKTLIEFTHRGLVAVVTILLLLSSTLAWWLYHKSAEVKGTIIIAVGFVFVQAALGAIGVIYGDPAWFLAFHFGCSLLAFVGVLLLVILLHQIGRRRRLGDDVHDDAPLVLRTPVERSSFTRAVWFTIIYMYCAMYYGAYVSSTGDGSAFRGWPFPTEVHSGRVFVVDILHRIVALGLVAFIAYLCVLATRRRKDERRLFVASWIALGFVTLLALSGAALVWTHVMLWAFLLHVSLVTCLFGTLSYLGLQILPVRRASATYVAKDQNAAFHRGPRQ